MGAELFDRRMLEYHRSGQSDGEFGLQPGLEFQRRHRVEAEFKQPAEPRQWLIGTESQHLARDRANPAAYGGGGCAACRLAGMRLVPGRFERGDRRRVASTHWWR